MYDRIVCARVGAWSSSCCHDRSYVRVRVAVPVRVSAHACMCKCIRTTREVMFAFELELPLQRSFGIHDSHSYQLIRLHFG